MIDTYHQHIIKKVQREIEKSYDNNTICNCAYLVHNSTHNLSDVVFGATLSNRASALNRYAEIAVYITKSSCSFKEIIKDKKHAISHIKNLIDNEDYIITDLLDNEKLLIDVDGDEPPTDDVYYPIQLAVFLYAAIIADIASHKSIMRVDVERFKEKFQSDIF